jgi:diguanylate cyclase (GGDEF)-like protein
MPLPFKLPLNILRNNLGWLSLSVSAVIMGLSSVLQDNPVDFPWSWTIAGVILGAGSTYAFHRHLLKKRQGTLALQGHLMRERQFFEQYLTQRLQERQNIALLLCEIDHPESLNGFESPTFAETSRHVRDVFQNCVRKGDLVTDLGTGSLAVIFPNTDEFIAIHIAERVRSHIEQLNISDTLSGSTKGVTISGGLGFCHTENAMSSAELLEVATHLLSLSKRRGRNQITHRIQGLFDDMSDAAKFG